VTTADNEGLAAERLDAGRAEVYVFERRFGPLRRFQRIERWARAAERGPTTPAMSVTSQERRRRRPRVSSARRSSAPTGV
jgi:hypothetical protein